MIFGYTGKPGNGKSYSVVEHVIIPALKIGRVIYHNMLLDEAAIRAIAGMGGELIHFDRDVTAAELVANAPPGALVCIDESMRYWPHGIKAARVPKEEVEFFTMHRHLVGKDGRSTDICLICQDFGSQCASFIRDLIEYTHRAVKLSSLGLSSRYRLETYQGCIKGDRPSEKMLIRKRICKFNKAIFACYKSHTLAEEGVTGEEVRDDTASVWKNWKVISAGGALVALPFMLAAAWLSIHSFRKQLGGSQDRPEHSDGPGPARPPAHVADARAATPAATIKDSDKWRYAGMMTLGKRIYWLVDGPHGSRRIDHGCIRDSAGEWVCTIDGERITAQTGPSPGVVASLFSAAGPVETMTK